MLKKSIIDRKIKLNNLFENYLYIEQKNKFIEFLHNLNLDYDENYVSYRFNSQTIFSYYYFQNKCWYIFRFLLEEFDVLFVLESTNNYKIIFDIIKKELDLPSNIILYSTAPPDIKYYIK